MRAPVVKPDSYREICEVDISNIRHQLDLLQDDVWDAEDGHKENRFAVFGSTRHIIARFVKGRPDPADYYSTPFWTVWQDRLLPVLHGVAGHYGFRNPDFPKVMFARLKAGGRIDPHRDSGPLNRLSHKIHIPIVTNDKVWFRAGTDTFQLAVGKAYELNNTGIHAVRNDGAEDRIHLIFEIFDRDAA